MRSIIDDMDGAAEPITPLGKLHHGRVIILIALLLVAGAATQGYLPGVVGEPRRPTAVSPAETIILAVLLAVSVGAVAIATVSRLRDPRAAAGSMGQLAESPWAVGGGCPGGCC